MNRRIALGIVTLLALGQGLVAFGGEQHEGLEGKWELRDDASNDWHYVTIRKSKDGEAGPYRWENKAGKSWACDAGYEQFPGGRREYTITFAKDSPYAGHVLKLVRDSDDNLVALVEYKPGVSIDTSNHYQIWVKK